MRVLQHNQNIINKVVRNLIDSVVVIEKSIGVKNALEKVELEKCINENKNAIDKLNERIELLNVEEMEIEQKDPSNRPGKCVFYDGGFCNLRKNCKFVHPEKTCEAYQQRDICSQVNCTDRHPKDCRYWKLGNCFRGNSCAYNHATKTNYNLLENDKRFEQERRMKCDLCHIITKTTYFCDLCKSDICNECTNKEAHDEDFFHENNDLTCKNLHKAAKDESILKSRENLLLN